MIWQVLPVFKRRIRPWSWLMISHWHVTCTVCLFFRLIIVGVNDFLLIITRVLIQDSRHVICQPRNRFISWEKKTQILCHGSHVFNDYLCACLLILTHFSGCCMIGCRINTSVFWNNYLSEGALIQPHLAAGYPTILRNLGFWVRKLTFLGFLADFTKGKWVFSL